MKNIKRFTAGALLAAVSMLSHAAGEYSDWNWGDKIATPADGTWYEVDARTRGCSPVSTNALRETERALLDTGITPSHGIAAAADGSRAASWSFLKGRAVMTAFSDRETCERMQGNLMKLREHEAFCDGVAGKFDATVGLKERGASESDALQIAQSSGAGEGEARLNVQIIRRVFEDPIYRGLTRAQVVKKARAECLAMS